jgi:hypothetical protein
MELKNVFTVLKRIHIEIDSVRYFIEQAQKEKTDNDDLKRIDSKMAYVTGLLDGIYPFVESALPPHERKEVNVEKILGDIRKR